MNDTPITFCYNLKKSHTEKVKSLRKHETGITTQVLARIDYTFKCVMDTKGHTGMARARSRVGRHTKAGLPVCSKLCAAGSQKG